MMKFKAHLWIKGDAKPVFHRSQTVPYAIKEVANREPSETS